MMLIFSVLPAGMASAPNEAPRSVPRAVLGELFTATWCQFCPAADGAFARFEQNTSLFPNKFTMIEWHPNDGSDTLGNPDTQARIGYYGGAVNGYPTGIFDGISVFGGGNADPNHTMCDQNYSRLINARPATSPIKLELDAKIVNGQSTYASVNVTALDSVAGYSNLKVSAVVVENLKITEPNKGYMAWTGRDTILSKSIAISQGETKKFSGSGNLDLTWHTADMGMVAFVQSDSTREVLQSIMVLTLPMVTDASPAVAANPVTALNFPEDTKYTGLDLNSMFTDPEGDELTFTNSSPAHIGVTINNGIANLTPSKEWNGVESIQFSANDGFHLTPVTNSVQVTVTTVNDPPFLKKGIGDFSMMEGTSKVGVKLSDSFGDIDSSLTYTFGSLAHLNVSIDKPTSTVTYTAPDLWTGKETVKFTASDGQLEVSTTVNVTVLHVNHAPTSKPIPDLEMPENGVDTSIDLGKVFADLDGFDTLSFSSENIGGHITATIDASNIVTIKPVQYWNGKELVVLSAADGIAEPVSVQVNVLVTPVNYAPEQIGVLEKISFDEETSHTTVKSLNGVFRDPDGDKLTIEPSLSPIEPSQYIGDPLTVTIEPDGTVTMAAAKDYFGNLRVVFTATDAGGLSAKYNCNVAVNNVQDAPVIKTSTPSNAKTITLNEGDTKQFNITAFDADLDILELTWSIDQKVRDSSADCCNVDENGLEYIATFTSAGTHKITAVVTDGKETAEITWTVKVNNVNRKPSVSIVSPINLASYNSGALIRFQAAGTDPDSDKLVYHWTSDGADIGNTADFTRTLPPGTHKIVLTVGDGTDTVTYETTLTVRSPPAKATPGFEGVILVAGILAALALFAKRK